MSVNRIGLTSNQLLSAPPNTMYVHRVDAGAYIKALCVHLGRTDIVPCRASLLERPHRFSGLPALPPMVIDHAVVMTDTQVLGLVAHWARRTKLMLGRDPAVYDQQAAQVASVMRRNQRWS